MNWTPVVMSAQIKALVIIIGSQKVHQKRLANLTLLNRIEPN